MRFAFALVLALESFAGMAQNAAAEDLSAHVGRSSHWAYQPPLRTLPHTSLPVVRGASPIDAFLGREHARFELSPAPPASQSTLLRRVYLDLIGLPPQRDELQAFLRDASPHSYARVVDRLLASPHYGQRWGRHWMDVWRYSDWTGYGNEIRYSQRHIWRWRDWIVESLNADRGYDRMILEMLAADELAPGDQRAARATGFLARNWYKFDRNSWLDDTIEHTCRAFLGMSIHCARCHDHKYDPISQEEYYRLRAVFEPYDVRTDRVPRQPDVTADGLARVYDAKPDAATYLFVDGDPKRADSTRPLLPGVPGAVRGPSFAVAPIDLPLLSYYPAMRRFVSEEMVAEADAQRKAAQSELSAAGADELAVAVAEKKVAAAEARLDDLRARVAAELAKHGQPLPAGQAHRHAAVAELERRAVRTQQHLALAEAEAKLAVAQRQLHQAKAAAEKEDASDAAPQAVLEARKQFEAAQQELSGARRAAADDPRSYDPLGPVYPQTSSGRRLALARWITSPSNPLTARVCVNHLWLRHFGQPLVEPVDDFGLRTSRPPLGDLLDYLACELMEHEWSMKHVHRLIVTSAAYRMSSRLPEDAAAAEATAIDADNRLFWRMNARRMEAELVRDAILHVAGELDVRLGGPDLDPAKGAQIPRRSLYFRHARERQLPLLQLFDAANPQECYRRRETVRPQQAFALVHSALALGASRRLAARLTRGQDLDEESFVIAAFQTVLSREPSAREVRACRQFLQQLAGQLAKPDELEPLAGWEDRVAPATDPGQRARENLVLVLLNHHEFVTIR